MANNAGTMRTLTDHIVAGDTAPQLSVTARDLPGSGGANHIYAVEWDTEGGIDGEVGQSLIYFQNGPIKEHGCNGVTEASLLAILIDRLRSFQAGPYASDQNQSALEDCQMALFSLQERTRLRIARGVEGTSQV